MVYDRIRSLELAFAVAVAVLSIAPQAHSQPQFNVTLSPLDGTTPPGLAPGSPAGSYPLSGFENVNLYSGRLNFALPLVRIQGRGSAGYNLTLNIEEKWHVATNYGCVSQGTCSTGDYAADADWNSINVGYGPGQLRGRLYSPPMEGGYNCDIYQPLPVMTLTRFSFKAPDGTEYELRDQDSDGKPGYVGGGCTISGVPGPLQRGTVFVSRDESALKFVADTPVYENQTGIGSTLVDPPFGNLLFRDGTLYRINNQGEVVFIRDRNGNQISFQYDNMQRVTAITDSLNRTTNISYFDVNGLGYDDITFPGAGGVIRHIKVFHANMDQALRTGFAIQDITQLFPELTEQSPGAFDKQVVTSVQLPNLRSYQFFYNSYAELSRVVLPTGGAFEYDYASGASSSAGVILGGSPGTSRIYRRVVARRTYSDGVTQEGAQVFSASSSPPPDGAYTTSSVGQTTVTVQHQNGLGSTLSTDTHNFLGVPAIYQSTAVPIGWPYSSWKEGKEPGTTLGGLKAAANTFQQGAHVSWWTNASIPPFCTGAACTEFEPAGDTHLVQVDTTLLDTNQLSRRTLAYDVFSNVTDTTDYAFGTAGSGAPGAALRQTHTDFAASTPKYNTATVYLPSLPTVQKTFLGSTQYSLTQYEYDCYQNSDCSNPSDPYHAPLVARPGIVQMDSSYATARYRGNPTNITRGVNGDTVSFFQYDVAGNVVAAFDGRQNKTTIDYASNGSTYAFRTTITNPLLQATNLVWDVNTGKPTRITDPNNNATSADYTDSLDRLKNVTYPDSGSVAYSYNDVGNTVTSTTAVSSSTNPCAGPANSQSDVVYDGLGRKKTTHLLSDPQGAVVTDTAYDALGRVHTVSNPYRSGTTPVYTTTTYDGLSRILSLQLPDNHVVSYQYTANQTKVTETVCNIVDTNVCPMTTTTHTVDALGRLMSVLEANNKQTTYSYDPLGNLTDANQGVQNRHFVYDSLSRLQTATNPENGSTSYTYDHNGNVLTVAQGGVTRCFGTFEKVSQTPL